MVNLPAIPGERLKLAFKEMPEMDITDKVKKKKRNLQLGTLGPKMCILPHKRNKGNLHELLSCFSVERGWLAFGFCQLQTCLSKAGLLGWSSFIPLFNTVTNTHSGARHPAT